MEALVGSTIACILADKGYGGHNAPPDHKFRVFISGQKRGVTPEIKRELRRRAAVEPVIGHLKAEHRMGRNYLWLRQGDAANAVLAAPARTSAASSAGSACCCAKSSPLSMPRFRLLQPKARVLHGRLFRSVGIQKGSRWAYREPSLEVNFRSSRAVSFSFRQFIEYLEIALSAQ